MRLHLRTWTLVVLFAAGLAMFGPRGTSAPPTPLHPAFGRGDGPEIALVHGLGSSGKHWLPVARVLARHHRVILVGLPGHGVSGMPEPFSLDRAVEGLDRALRDRTRGPVILVGHSMGGLVAAAEALAHPERVSALVLVEAALKPQGSPESRAAISRELDDDYHGLLRRAYLSFGRDSAQGEQLLLDVESEESLHVRRWIRLALTADLSGRADRIRLPVLAVLSDRSWPMDEPWETVASDLGYERLPLFTPKRVTGCGHFLMLDDPETLARIIQRFVGGIAPGPIARVAG